MTQIRATLSALLLLAGIAPAIAQSFPMTLPANTVYGRLGTVAGPGQAIPFSTLRSNLRLGISVTDYGAVGNNTTDDSVAINTAINTAFAAGGGNVYLPRPAACYRLASPIVMKAGVSLRGDQGLASCINADNVDAITFAFITGFGNVVIDGLYITGSNTSTVVHGINQAGTTSSADQIYGLTISNTIISGFPVGMHFRTVRNLNIDNVWIQNVDNGIQFVGQVINATISNTKVIRAAASISFGDIIGLELDSYPYVVGGSLPPEGIKIQSSTFFGFQTPVKLANATYVALDQVDVSGVVYGIQIGSVNNGLFITNGYIEMTGAGAAAGIYLPGQGSSVPTQISIENNGFVGSGTVGASGIQINDSGNTNQFNINIIGNYFSGFTSFDILAYNPGQMNIEKNRCNSTLTTHSISIGTRQAGTITVTGNNCTNDIAYTTASDLTNGYIRVKDNVVNSTTQQAASWNIEAPVAPFMTFAGPTTSRKTYTLPDASDTIVTLTAAQELTSKTLTSSVGKGTWTASGTWTLPAYTLGGTVSGGGNQINNVIIGTTTPLAGFFTSVAVSGNSAPTNGIYLPSANTVGLTTNGSSKLTIDSSGNVGIGSLTASTYNYLSFVLAIGSVTDPSAGAIGLVGARTADNAVGSVQFNNDVIGGSERRIAQIRGLRSGANNSGAIDFTVWNAGVASTPVVIGPTGAVNFSAGVASTSSTTGTAIITGGIGASGAIWAGTYMSIGAVAVASLPSCAAGTEGARASVNNSNAASFTAGIGAVVAGGGTTHVPVYCDGTNWRIGANDNVPSHLIWKFA